MPKEGLMIASQVAEYLNCSVSTVRRLVLKARIPHFRLGKLVRFRRADIDVWLIDQREGELPAESSRQSPVVHPDQLSLFRPDVGRDLEF